MNIDMFWVKVKAFSVILTACIGYVSLIAALYLARFTVDVMYMQKFLE